MEKSDACPLKEHDYVTSKSNPDFIGQVIAIENNKANVIALPMSAMRQEEQQNFLDQEDLVAIDIEEAMWKRYNQLEGDACLKNKPDFKRACELFGETLVPWCVGMADKSAYESHEDALVGFVKCLMGEFNLSMQDACAESRRVFSANDDISAVS